MKYAVVTSMSDDMWKRFGWKCHETFDLFWPGDCVLTVYSEDIPTGGKDGRSIFCDLRHDGALSAFLLNCGATGDYRFDAAKFAKKVFALTGDYRLRSRECDWLIWLDADTETHAPVRPEFLDTLCPDWALASYLGRKDWHTSECGFVAYNLNNGGREFLADFRKLYTSGDIYNHLEWHDSYLFDRLREKYEAEGHRFHNLSEGIPGMHVWDESPLGTVMRHHKGPLRQKGVKPGDADVPDSYWSEKERSCATTA